MSPPDLLERGLPLHARRALRDVVERLRRRLLPLSPGEAEGEAVAAALFLVHQRLIELRRSNAELMELLAVGRWSGQAVAAAREALERLEREGRAGLPTGARPGAAPPAEAESSAVQDRLLLRLVELRQEWEVLAAALSDPASLSDELARALAGAALQLLGAGELHWTLRVAAVGLAARLCAHPAVDAALLCQALLERACAPQEEPWVQAEAAQAWCGLQRDVGAVEALLRSRLMPAPAERRRLPAAHLFVRARLARLAGERGAWGLLREALEGGEPSEHVRLCLVQALLGSEREEDQRWLEARCLDVLAEPALSVRARALIFALPDRERPGRAGWLPRVRRCLEGADRPVQEALVQAIWDRWEEGLWSGEQLLALSAELGPALHALSGAAPAELRRQADALRHVLAVEGSALAPALAELRAWLGRSSMGEHRDFREGALARLRPEELLDVMAAAAWSGMDLSAEPLGPAPNAPPRRGYRVFHGERPGFAAWRLWHEARHPRPEKRQGVTHLTDRRPPGPLVALSGRMSEVTPTEVPGQRCASPSTLHWGEELPLPVHLLCAAERGELQLRSPSLRMRLSRRSPLALARAHQRYVETSALRARLLERPLEEARALYAAHLAELGIDWSQGEARALALPALLPILVPQQSLSIAHLALMAGLWGAGWIGRNLWRQRAHRRWRSAIPLVVGGWGSRGKSGTERIKAAVFHGLGYTVLSKTTGCEAMVVVGIPGQRPREVFLYRPYDKATIVEQRDVLGLAAEMGVQVLLWECMALNIDYVDILQAGLMADDYTTITNTYPDHEDIQGPSGLDVAESIAAFVPPQGRLLTSEQHMGPVLAQRARDRGAQLRALRAEDWLLLPRDLLARLPYAEHPRNVALALELARWLEVPMDVALRAMAEHVVPDVGVLKEYGPLPYEGGRLLTFVNGMSANERAGFMSNWERMGFGRWGEAAGLEDQVILLVNNRADRLARQGVFARIAAVDAVADVVAVINTNVGPFMDAWRRELRALLRPQLLELGGGGGPEERRRLVAAMARRLRRAPLSAERARELALARPGVSAPAVDALIAELWSVQVPLDPLAAALVRHPLRPGARPPRQGPEALEQWLREVSWLHRLEREVGWSMERAVDGLIALLEARALPLDNPELSGDQIIHALAMSAPPDTPLRILGSSNIKGAGLGYVYRWVSVQAVRDELQRISALEPAEAGAALRQLSLAEGYGVGDGALVLQALEEALAEGRYPSAERELRLARELVASRCAQARAALAVQAEPGRWQRWRRWWRGQLDVVDAIRRRSEAERLMSRLAAREVGLDQAARLAEGIMKRQK